MKKFIDFTRLQFIAGLYLSLFLFIGTTSAQWVHTGQQSGNFNVIFSNGNDLVAGMNGSGGSVVLSQNNGANWSNTNSGIPSGADVRAFGSNSSYVFAGTQSGLFRCANDGNYNWSLVLNGGYWSIYVTDNDLFAGTLGAGLFHSTDNGNTWTSTTSGMALYPDVYALASNGTYIFAGMYAGNGTANSPNAGVYRSSDNGATWTQKANGLTNYDVFCLLVKGNYIFAGTNGGVFRSADNGDNWTYVAGGSVHSLKLACGTDIYAGLLNNGGVSRSIDDGNTWTGYNGGTGWYQTAVTSLTVLGSQMFAATLGIGIFKTDLVCSSNSTCIDFEDSTPQGWQANNGLETIKLDGSNHYIETTDQSGPTSFSNTSKPLTGDWTTYLTGGCGSFCWDENYFYAGDGNDGTSQPITITPAVRIYGNGFSGYFLTNTTITAGDGWHTFCAPLALINPGDLLPSNSEGHWVIDVGTDNDWNSMLSNITQVRFSIDPTSYQSERFGFDNICLSSNGDCTPPLMVGSLCGIKFNDLNGNGIKDSTESGIQNWIINLKYQNAAGFITLTDTTDANGSFCFDSLQPGGTYTVSEVNQSGWQQTYPATPGTYTITLGSGQHIDTLYFGNHQLTASLCDSLKATASKTSPDDCNWSLSLNQPVSLSNVSAIKIECLSPNQFTTGTGLGTNFQNWFASGNTFYPPTSNGKVPGGNLADFFHMNINYVTSPQIVVVTWLDTLGAKVCSDTLRLDCQISCTTILNDTVACNNNGYTFSYKFTNNATYGISNIEYTLQSPSSVTISPLADTLFSELGAGSTSGIQNIQISGGMPGDTVKILAKFISSGGCCWCFETFTAILPNCASICDSLGISATGSKEDCCYTISLTNNSATNFSSVQFQLISGGMFSTYNTVASPGWAVSNISPNNMINLIKLPFAQGIGNGSFNNVLDMCIRQYPDSNQVIAVKWIKDGQIVCRDTLRFVCIETSPKTDTCSQVIDGKLTCLENGKVQYIFRVQNNSAINSSGFGIFPMSPGVTFSKTVFNNVNILPGQVSPLDTVIISGIGSDHRVCLQTSIFVTVDSFYNYCCHSDTVCITTPDCGTKDSLEACVIWSLLNDSSATSVSGNVSANVETLSAGSSSPFMGVFYPYTSDGQRLLAFGGWPAGSLDLTRYIEFKISPNSGNSYTVNSVSFNYGDNPLPANFNIIKSQVFYSTDNFGNSNVQIGAILNYLNSSMSTFSVSNLNVFVGNGGTFSLRIYPYSTTGSLASTVSLAIHNNVEICGITNGITAINEGSVIPMSYQLKQNFPNPFNPSSVIQYDIPKTGFVKINVYDILGREIRVLVNELKGPGQYSVIFDASNLTSGVYFYKIQTGAFIQIKKMLLIK